MAKPLIARAVLMRILIAVVVLGAALGLLELWGNVFGGETFLKLAITLVVIGIACGILLAVVSDIDQEETQRKDNYLN